MNNEHSSSRRRTLKQLAGMTALGALNALHAPNTLAAGPKPPRLSISGVGRKIIRDGAKSARNLFAEMRELDGGLASNADESAAVMRAALKSAIDDASAVVDWLLDVARRDPRLPAAASIKVLHVFGTLLGGYEMARALLAASRQLAAGEGDPQFLKAKVVTARFYAEQILPQTASLRGAIADASETALAFDVESF